MYLYLYLYLCYCCRCSCLSLSGLATLCSVHYPQQLRSQPLRHSSSLVTSP